MGKKIFVSYKYADEDVLQLSGHSIWNPTTVRDYVDQLASYLDASDNVYKGERDGEDLSYLSEDQIWERLKDKIYDSTVTIIFISPNMRESYKRDRDQWIPWEVSYSLKEMTRNDRTSRSNALLAIVLPDRNGKYDYYLSVSNCGSTTHHTDRLFGIIAKNKFNYKYIDRRTCPKCGGVHCYGTTSYIEAVKWGDFISSPQYYINEAVKRKDNISSYEIIKEV